MSEAETSAHGDLAVDTAVKPLLSTPGLYTADMSDRWSLSGPSGGVLMTTALRAMGAQLDDPGLRIHSATAVFCAPVSPGALAIRVEVLRVGASAAQVRASLSSVSRPGPGVELLATFARTRSGPEVADARFPDVLGPGAAEDITAELREPAGPLHEMSFFRNFEVRLAAGHRWWSDGPGRPGAPRCAMWFRYLAPPRERRMLHRLAIPPLVDTMPPAVWQALDSGRPKLHAPSLDLTVHFLEDTSAEWLLAASRARYARRGYATAEIEIWSEDGKLVAYGTQTMTFRPLSRRQSSGAA